MSAMSSPICSFTMVYSTVYSSADQRKHQSSVSLAFVRGIHRWPANSPHKRPVTRKLFPFDDVIMQFCLSKRWLTTYVIYRMNILEVLGSVNILKPLSIFWSSLYHLQIYIAWNTTDLKTVVCSHACALLKMMTPCHGSNCITGHLCGES